MSASFRRPLTSDFPGHRWQHKLRRGLRRSLLVCLVLVTWFGVRRASAQFSCPAPWSSASNVYGVIVLEGSGVGQSGTISQKVHQHSVVGTKMALNGICSWQAIPTLGIGQMVNQATIDDTQTDSSSGDTWTWVASGMGDSQGGNSSLSIIPALGQYGFGTFDSVTGTFTPPPPQTAVTEGIVWGAANTAGGASQQLPFPASVPLIFGTAVYNAPAEDMAIQEGLPLDANWNLTWMFSPLPDDTCDTCKDARGSAISLRNQSLGEDIAIVGTPFFLHYESGRENGRAGADVIAVKDALGLGGWTLSVHHALDPLLMVYCAGGSCTPYAVVPKALFLGNGNVRDSAQVQAPLFVGSKLHLTSEDGSEIYVFDGLKHVQTLLPMTGAVLYNFGYDANGQLVTVTDGSGNVTTIQRDANEHPTAIVSPYGQTTTLTVDANGYLSQVTDPLGNTVQLTNTALGLLTSMKDANGNLYSFQYDGNGFLTKDSDPAGGVINLARTNNGAGYSVTETTAQGRANTNLVAFSNSSASTTQQFTNTWWNGLQATESKTQQSGQLSESVSLPNGTSYSKSYRPDPRWGIQLPVVTGETFSLGNLTMTLTGSRTASLGNPADPFSLVTQTDTETINGRSYKSVFTAATKTFVDTTPVGRTTTTVLDALERISTLQPPAGALASFTYDTRGRLSSSSRGTRQTSFSYDANGRVASITDPLNLTRSFTYDAAGRLLSTTLEDGRLIHYTYDANGNLTSISPPGSSTHSYSYSPVNLPTAYTPPVVSGGGATTYSFSPDREVTKITRPDGQAINYNYDAAGRISSVLTPSSTISYAYDPTTGRRSSASISGGESIAYSYNGLLPTGSTWSGTVAGSISRSYDKNFWINSESMNGGTSVAFVHDKDGLLSKAGVLILKHNAKTGLYTGSTLGSAKDTPAYNTFAELKTYTAKHLTVVQYKVIYTRDGVGRITGLKETIGGTTTSYAYTFDAAGRLTGVKKGAATVATYTYDSNSNRLSATTASGTVNGTYDAQDRLLTYGNASYTYNANGELATKTVGSSVTTYQYDVLGNLTAATLPNATHITYIIDAENNRVGKLVNGTLVSGFLYDGNALVAQLDSNNQIVSQFIYGSGGNSPDYMVTGGVSYRIFSDHRGSPRLVVDSTSGQIVERIDYDEFGNVISDTNPGFQPFGFAGGLYDQDTQLLRFGARDFDPATGRWTAKDPVRFVGGDSNLYGYVLNDPVNMIDPQGLEGTCPCKDKDAPTQPPDLKKSSDRAAERVAEQSAQKADAKAPFTPQKAGSTDKSSSSSGPSISAPSLDVGGGIKVTPGAGSVQMTAPLQGSTRGDVTLEFSAKDLSVSVSRPVTLPGGLKADFSLEVNGKDKKVTATLCHF